MFYKTAVGRYKKSSMLWKLYDASICKQEFQFWQTEKYAAWVFKDLKYFGHGDFLPTIRCWTSLMMEIDQASLSEQVDEPDDDSSGWSRVIRPMRSTASWIKHIVTKFSKPGQVLVETCVGLFSITFYETAFLFMARVLWHLMLKLYICLSAYILWTAIVS